MVRIKRLIEWSNFKKSTYSFWQDKTTIFSFFSEFQEQRIPIFLFLKNEWLSLNK